MKEGQCKTEDHNHSLQIVLRRNTDLTAFLLYLQASILFPPTEQFALHATSDGVGARLLMLGRHGVTNGWRMSGLYWHAPWEDGWN